MPKISLDNLERYDGHLKDWCDARFASKSVNENWSETEEAGAVQFYPVSDTEIHPVVKFSFKETLPASGDKSPTNPSTITGISAVKVTRCGKNIIPYPYFSSAGIDSKGVTWSVASDGSVTATGTASGATTFHITIPYWNLYSGNMNQALTLPAGTYYYSGCPSGGDWNKYRIRCYFDPDKYSDYITVSNDIGSGGYVTLTRPCVVSFGCEVSAGFPGENNTLTFKPQLELVSPFSDFEPYEGNSYNIPFNNTYYGGSIDLATGLMTVTMQYMVADSNAEIIWIGTNFVAWRFPAGLNCIGRAVGTEVCSHFPFSGAWDDSFAHFYATPSSGLYLANPNWTASTYRQYFTDQYNNGTPVTACYQLANPFTVQLSPLQIKSLTQSNLYTPRLNTVYTDADTVKIRYQKSPIVTSSDIDNAILSLGGD